MFDFATLTGIVVGLGVLAYAIMSSANVGLIIYLNLPSVLITFGGAICATIVQFPLRDLLKIPKVIINTLIIRNLHPEKLLKDLVKYSETARRDGILALEGIAEAVNDEFLKKGLQLAIDGTDPELVNQMLNAELDNLTERHEKSRKLVEAIGFYCPAFGLIGTLVGLIAMLKNLQKFEVIGPSMAIALLTTLYGAVGAYLVFIPLTKKLEGRSKEERLVKEMIITGILSIQSGDNPRIVEQKLMIFLPPHLRKIATVRK